MTLNRRRFYSLVRLMHERYRFVWQIFANRGVNVMLRLCMRVLFFSSALVIGIPVQADMIRFEAILTHDQEVINPPIPDEGSSGKAVFFLNDARTRLTYDITLVGLDLGFVKTDAPNKGLTTAPGAVGDTADPNDDVLRGHIHRAIAGLNGGIVFGFIDNATALLNDQNDLTVDKASLRIMGAWDLTEGNPTGISVNPPVQSIARHGAKQSSQRWVVHQLPHERSRRRRDPRPDPARTGAHDARPDGTGTAWPGGLA